MKKQEIDLIKSFMTLEENISQDKQKLYDRLHDTKLSHNRKKKALQKIKEKIEHYTFQPLDYELKLSILKLCDNALFSDGRDIIDGKHGIQRRKK